MIDKPKFANHSVTAWGFTYFVKRGNAIKIGHSAIPKQRISGLQVGFPEPLEILAIVPNTFITEADAHAKFAHLRIQGEWFEAHPDLIEFILAVKIEASSPPAPPPDRAQADATKAMVRSLSALRKAHGHNTPMGHACSNVIEGLSSMRTYVRPGWATDERQTLPYLIMKQTKRIAELKTGAH
jgi:hypothetical protein